MTPEEIERALCTEAELTPSSGFVGGVMDAVLLENLAPAPIPFPWKRALPGLVASVLAFMAIIVAAWKNNGNAAVHETPVHQTAWLTSVVHAISGANLYGLGWAALAIAITLVCVTVSLRFLTGDWLVR